MFMASPQMCQTVAMSIKPLMSSDTDHAIRTLVRITGGWT